MAIPQAKKTSLPKNRRSILTWLTVLLAIQTPLVILFCLFALSSFSNVTWMEQTTLSVLAVVFMAVAITAPIVSTIWIRQKAMEKVFARTRYILLLLTTGPFIAILLTQLLGIFFSSTVENSTNEMAYMRTISVIASAIVATGTLAYTAGIFGIVGVSVTTYCKNRSKRR